MASEFLANTPGAESKIVAVIVQWGVRDWGCEKKHLVTRPCLFPLCSVFAGVLQKREFTKPFLNWNHLFFFF